MTSVRSIATLLAAALLAGTAGAQTPASRPKSATRPRNVIIFLGDAGGLPTLSAGGILAHDRPQSLFIQSMPHVGLSDTSSLDRWVTDSAAGMTAIVTGHKTNNGWVSMVPAADGTPMPVKTLFEHAEERGLATGIITNMPIWDATPAACYAHVASRRDKDTIFAQMLAPRFGDGTDVLIGKGSKDATAVFAKQGLTPDQAFAKAGYSFGNDPANLGRVRRAAVLRDTDYALFPAVEATVGQLARNPKGYVLMVEWDMHTDAPRDGLRHVVEMDDTIRRVSATAGPDTLILFTADHSFGLRMMGGTRGTPLAGQYEAAAAKPGATVDSNPVIGVEDGHSGEEVIAAATGPGAERVRGFFPNTRLFDMLINALGWRSAS